MKRKNPRPFLILCILLSGIFLHSVYGNDTDTSRTDTLSHKENLKKGWSFGAVPAIAFDSDIGFKYGAVLELWNYGDGRNYPLYNHYYYFEYSNTTKGSQIIEFNYDSRVLLSGVRTLLEASYLTEKALDFYGYNGYESLYNPVYEDDSWYNREVTGEYRSRLYYRQERKLLRLRTDFQGRFFDDRFKWLSGVTYYNTQIDTIDTDRLNKGQTDSLKLPYGGGLYGQYAYQWNIIPEDQVNGGITTLLKSGIMYDTRDKEANPMKGIWTEALFFWAPDFLASGGYGFAKIALTHRQYFTIVPDRLSFVYRLAYQGKLWGEMPTYMLPLILNGGQAKDRDGLGGAKTVRGMLRNRVVGENYLYGNFEFRWKFLKTIVFKQNLYLALNTFVDFGRVTGKYPVDISDVPEEHLNLFPVDKEEKFQITYGAGFHIALNENFVIAINNGYTLDPRDGRSGLYIGLKWLF
jgi:hypothetical protein